MAAVSRRKEDRRPRFGIAPDNAYLDPSALFTLMSPIPGSSAGGRSGTFTLTTTAGNYGWIAVRDDVTTAGLVIFDGLGTGNWNGAGLTGNNTGGGPDPCLSSVVFSGWRFFRQDFVNANPTPNNFTIS